MLMLWQHPTGVLPNLFNKFFPKKIACNVDKIDEKCVTLLLLWSVFVVKIKKLFGKFGMA
jgi:hypothetical protein